MSLYSIEHELITYVGDPPRVAGFTEVRQWNQ
jgi:hypothetical protein